MLFFFLSLLYLCSIILLSSVTGYILGLFLFEIFTCCAEKLFTRFVKIDKLIDKLYHYRTDILFGILVGWISLILAIINI